VYISCFENEKSCVHVKSVSIRRHPNMKF